MFWLKNVSPDGRNGSIICSNSGIGSRAKMCLPKGTEDLSTSTLYHIIKPH